MPFTRTRSPLLIRSVATDVPTTAGIPNSRATTAGCAATRERVQALAERVHGLAWRARIALRDLASKGQIPGMVKSSW